MLAMKSRISSCSSSGTAKTDEAVAGGGLQQPSSKPTLACFIQPYGALLGSALSNTTISAHNSIWISSGPWLAGDARAGGTGARFSKRPFGFLTQVGARQNSFRRASLRRTRC
mmetsp:Transcript_99184/g.318227  ORF Transcript_99184/g.318227 Transcript_99184/m.318227 type:complete len:113 (-) Transcript_99184:51-389(-)